MKTDYYVYMFSSWANDHAPIEIPTPMKQGRKCLLVLALCWSAWAQLLLPISAGGERPNIPTDSPGAGTYSSTQSVTLSDAGSTAILYTTNSSTPACPATGTLYTGAISVAVTTTIKAIGCNGVTGGGVLTSIYTITGGALSWATLTNGNWTGLTNGQWTGMGN